MLTTINKLDDNEPVILYTLIPNSCLKNKANNKYGKIIKHYGILKDVPHEVWGDAIKKYSDDLAEELDTDGKFINTEFLKNVTDDMIVDNKVIDYSTKGKDMFANFQKMSKAIEKYPSTICLWGNIDANNANVAGIVAEHHFIIHYNAKVKDLLSKYLKQAEEVENMKKQKTAEDKKALEWSDDNLIE